MTGAVDQFVSDHAVLRFLERIYGVDVEAVRDQIRASTARGVEAGVILDDGTFSVVVAHVRFIVRDGRIVSAKPRGWRFRPKAKSR
ncbi:hypothetical protein [Methylopila sp. M107]|uniref:hypothetical protein n=1 Tax=Methylopila sp. M107 TaxID=1101190 RepID=UPI0003799E80|nr:hypothetical protein [Methylopila sp. M107]